MYGGIKIIFPVWQIECIYGTLQTLHPRYRNIA